MPEERLVKAAEISVFAHATEDEEKVKQAVKRIAPYEHAFESQRLGHRRDHERLGDRLVVTDRLRRIRSLNRSLPGPFGIWSAIGLSGISCGGWVFVASESAPAGTLRSRRQWR